MSNFDHGIRPFIYADVDLNYIDGSAIWVTSLIETLSQDQSIKPTLLLKSQIKRGILIDQLLKKDNVEIIDPFDNKFAKEFSGFFNKGRAKGERLQPKEASRIMDYLDQVNQYDLFVVRGYKLSQIISQNYTFSFRTWFYLTDFPQDLDELTEKDRANLKILYKNSSSLACQTPDLIEYFKDILDLEEYNNEKFIYLPPMIPNVDDVDNDFSNKSNRLIYAGKFAPYWKIPEMFIAFNKMNIEQAEFVVIGDKFHNFPFKENYQEEVVNLLENSKQIKWLHGLERSGVQEEIKKSDLGISWRDKELDDSKEISTKVLEYGLYGKPVIMNRNELHERVFGQDYPLYANSETEFIEKVHLAFTNQEVYQVAAKTVFEVSSSHTFKSISKYLNPILSKKTLSHQNLKEQQIRTFNKTNILFAGHDLKFAKMLIDYFSSSDQYNVKLDNWQGHNSHDVDYSQECLDWANVIIAEWGLGNAVWYSNRKRNDQKMIVRMHLQEISTDYPKEINWNAVDKLIFIAPKLKEQMFEAFSFLPEEKTKIIYNLVDTNKLDRENLPESRFNIGIQGIVPQRKRLDLALDIFEKIWQKDHRYTLYIKGKLPNEYPWLWKREDEKNYYLAIFNKINSSKYRNSVAIEGWGEVSEWYPKLGFVISSSDFESFHLSVAEGMASRTIPIIRNWGGSAELYPSQYIFNDINEAAEKIETYANMSQEDFDVELNKVRDFIVRNYDKEVICKEWETLINNLYQKELLN